MNIYVLSATLGLSLLSPQSASKNRQHARSAIQKSFVCPDANAAKACKSFSELVAARDKEVFKATKENSMVCFRQKTDEFVLFSGSVLPMSVKQVWQPDADADSEKQLGTIFISGYKDGASDQSLQDVAIGYWKRSSIQKSPTFTGEVPDGGELYLSD